jgi:hypothetical protein
VARSWLYTQPDLLARINTEPPPARPAPTKRTTASDQSWQRRLELAHQRIKKLAEETPNYEPNSPLHTANAEPNKSSPQGHRPPRKVPDHDRQIRREPWGTYVQRCASAIVIYI